MKPLRIHQRLLIFLLLVLALTCVISPWMALGADWFAARWPDLLPERVEFSRVFNRAFMVAGFILFIAFRRQLLSAQVKSLLLSGVRVACRNLLGGFGLAAGSVALLLALMASSEVYTPFFRLTLSDSLSRCIGAFFTGLVVGFFEEVFFRGILFLGLREIGGSLRAYLLANLFYSALHFVKPGDAYFLDGVAPLAGFRHLLTTFHPFLNPLPLLPGIFGLFLIGVILSYALVKSGNLYLSIGLHAGWVFGLKTIRVFGDFNREELGWLFGSTDPKIVSGLMTWLGVLLVGLVVSRLTRPGAQLSPDRPPAAAA
ncbi:MAG: lysostaphin resistance A-like protein [Chloroflexota bacterium]